MCETLAASCATKPFEIFDEPMNTELMHTELRVHFDENMHLLGHDF